ncbi:uncharacterized protein BDZ99DRAFT_29835 [Mytilinidion resinicola]|uniref:Uncharacterized protein n=1 Tax=Mytilinidion resinicola TaxID=574789 RepID=A0A6A6YLR8_9PEZI|nr:uncharacterized protein BDZ99DRAFT_29835 [Mytilinidion resinicola]KAF2809513.1 hypothetical protein BDZ99DRAFT_29835 [Mytilinidion resinicola]
MLRPRLLSTSGSLLKHNALLKSEYADDNALTFRVATLASSKKILAVTGVSESARPGVAHLTFDGFDNVGILKSLDLAVRGVGDRAVIRLVDIAELSIDDGAIFRLTDVAVRRVGDSTSLGSLDIAAPGVSNSVVSRIHDAASVSVGDSPASRGDNFGAYNYDNNAALVVRDTSPLGVGRVAICRNRHSVRDVGVHRSFAGKRYSVVELFGVAEILELAWKGSLIIRKDAHDILDSPRISQETPSWPYSVLLHKERELNHTPYLTPSLLDTYFCTLHCMLNGVYENIKSQNVYLQYFEGHD